MARTNNLSNFLTDVADAIKEKKGDETVIPAANFDTEILNLPSGGAEDVEDFPIYDTWLQKAKTIYGDIVLPYIILEYIQSTGTQYIKTGIAINKPTDIEIQFSNATGGRIFGTSGDMRYELLGNEGNLPAYTHRISMNGAFARIRKSSILQESLTIKMDGSTGDIYLDGNKVNTLSSTYTGGQELYLFFGNGNYGYLNLYYCKVWQNNSLVRDFIPVKRKSDNEICLYDKVSKLFFTNAGSGSFIGGEY